MSDPATGEVIGDVADGGPAEVTRAIEAAHRAFRAWAAMPARERAPILHRVQSLMEAHREDLAHLVTRENGKPLEEARREVTFALGYFGWFAEEARRAYGHLVPSPARDKRLWVLRQPLGVVAAITPWNFPATMVTRKIAPALAAGCTVVLKPASATPLTALMPRAALRRGAALPKGVFNVVTGSRSGPIGSTLVEHPLVAKLAFTGSTDVGKALTAAAARTLKRVSLELGGNAPFVVFDDADLDAAVEGAVAMKFLRVGGQSCICANRIFVQAAIADRFVPRFVDGVRALKVGPGTRAGRRRSALSSTTRPAARWTSWSRTPSRAAPGRRRAATPSARARSHAATSTRRRSCSTRATRCASARRRSSDRSPPSSRSTRRAS